MITGPVLVAGATGKLGRTIVQKLRAEGVSVRALARHPEKVPALAASGADVLAVDLLDLPKVTEACRGVAQVVSTANNNMGKGAMSPLRIDLTAHQNLCAAARNAGVRRILYTSFRGATAVDSVDIFRLKWHIADAVRRSQVPYVIMCPAPLMDIWVDEMIAAGIRKNGVTMIFGDGTAVANYIAVHDVADFALRILAREDVVNESIDVGGPSNISFNDMATLIEKRLGAPGKRRHIPLAAMKLLPFVIKPFSETVARMMTIGHYAATEAKPFPDWKKTADRFGVMPETVESYVARLPVSMSGAP
jgi:NADH dehydrogenase